MNYDDWKQQTPDNDEYQDCFECPECGARVDKKNQICSQECQEASDL